MRTQPALKPKKYIADKSLQLRIGTGPLNEETIKKCQDVMDNNELDFTEDALGFLNDVKTAIETLKQQGSDKKTAIANMTAAIMQLKANGALFGYPLLGDMANITLSFLESIQEIDNDAIEITQANYKTLHAIIIKKLKGDGGDFGRTMKEELQKACNRYFTKH
ncbi:MAG: hypothetical protein ACRBCT_00210 [Alphaproteobacteria bacterium]